MFISSGFPADPRAALRPHLSDLSSRELGPTASAVDQLSVSDASRQGNVIGTIVPLYFISSLLFAIRMISRGWPTFRYGWDDFFITWAMVRETMELTCRTDRR